MQTCSVSVYSLLLHFYYKTKIKYMKTKKLRYLAMLLFSALIIASCSEKDDDNGDDNGNGNDDPPVENKAPVADFSISPQTGNTDTLFTFDASASYDEETPAAELEVRWDWQNDGDWDTDYTTEKTHQRKFEVQGDYTIALQVRDTADSTDVATRNLTVDIDPCPDVFTDPRDQREYTTVEIGDQCWMKENLNAGVMIFGSQDMTDNGTLEKYCYDNNAANCNEYGALYQWNELMQYTEEEGTQGICPEGWHVPTDVEWMQLEMELGMTYDEATSSGFRGTNEAIKLRTGGSSGFDAQLAGYRSVNSEFINMNQQGGFFTSTKALVNPNNAWVRFLFDDQDRIYRIDYQKRMALSVRCLRDAIR